MPPTSVADATVFACVYGPGKGGKTTDMLYSFPRSLFIGVPAAFKPSIGVVGFNLGPNQVWEAPSIMQLSKAIQSLNKDFDAVVVDDFSLLTEKTLSLLERTNSGHKLWGAMRDALLDFRDAARSCSKHVIVNCHVAAPVVKNGTPIRGGPMLPGRMAEDFPKQCDIVLRSTFEMTRRGPWQVVYRCAGDRDFEYTTGDRHGVTPDNAPMNLGEILKAAGYKFRRAPGLEWMDEAVATLVEGFKSIPVDQRPNAMPNALQYIATKTQNPLHARWVLRDTFDRIDLANARQSNVLAAFMGQAPGFGPAVPSTSFGTAPAPTAPAPTTTTNNG